MQVGLTQFLLVGAGGAMGAMLRLAALSLLMPLWGTMLVNIAGSFLMGVLVAQSGWMSAEHRLLLGTGLLGGFTTFSAFSADVGAFAQNGAWGLAGLYVLGSVALSLLGFWAGFMLTKA